MRRLFNSLFVSFCFVFVLLQAGVAEMPADVRAAEVSTSTEAAGSTKTAETKTTVGANIIPDITPAEPDSSDLKVLHTVTKLASSRWIQSFTLDSRYYYFIQMTNAKKGHLRITRVKYNGLGKYRKDHMDLKYFGHATNLDCSIYKGKTYLWTGSNAASGSDVSRAISCFKYKKGSVLSRHASVYYRIPLGGKGKYVTNVYPAINENSSKLAVRFTLNGKQYYQIYALKKGRKINARKPLKQVVLAATAGDFQGFDIYKNTIYTIEGSPRKSFLKGYDPGRIYQPTIIRTCDIKTMSTAKKTIRGAKALTFREPEGIKVLKGKKVQIMYVSNTLTDQSCNIYQVK
ncbi:MAG: hypothetical protein IJ137_05020 [Eubacterium sp.]|nr:hypothetical protein [Eubacterium sp.]